MIDAAGDTNRVDVSRLRENETAYAVIHAVLPSHVERLLSGKSDAFGKYVGFGRISEPLASCRMLMIYESHRSKNIVGDARIHRLDFMTADQIVKGLGDRFFLTEIELDSYSNGRRRPLLVFELHHFRRYITPIALKRPLTMAGQMVSRSEFDRLAEIGTHHSSSNR